MNVTLPSPLEAFVHDRIAAGEFQSVDAVVCEGLKLLQQRETWKASARQKIEEGWAQTQAGELLTSEQSRESMAQRKNAWFKSRGE
jgi:antitoxin ParD1/3/4